jgi:hypothetical protein
MLKANPPVIGLCGYARVGKDTAGMILTNVFDYKRAAFAEKLREMAIALNPLIQDRDITKRYNEWIKEFGYDIAKEKVAGIRPFLVSLGESVRNVLGEETWINAVIPLNYNGPPMVITDVRYKNEADRVKMLGGIIVQINKPGVIPANHTEATSISQIIPDIIINNDQTIYVLEGRIVEAIRLRL